MERMAKLGERKSFLSYYPENIAGNVTFSPLLSPALSLPSVHQPSKETFNDSILLGSHDPCSGFFPHHPPFPTANTPPCHCFKLLNNSLLFSSPVTIGYLDYFQSFALPITFKKYSLTSRALPTLQSNRGANSMTVLKAFHKRWRISFANRNQASLSLGADDIVPHAHSQRLAVWLCDFPFVCHQ